MTESQILANLYALGARDVTSKRKKEMAQLALHYQQVTVYQSIKQDISEKPIKHKRQDPYLLSTKSNI